MRLGKSFENLLDNLFGASQPAVSLESDFAVFDFETTGLDPEKDKILSFAYLRMRGSEIVLGESLDGFLISNSKISSAEIHQVTKEDLAKGFTEEKFIEASLAFIGESTLVGHHVAFDLACLNQLLKNHNIPPLKNPTVDTAQLGARIENPLMKQYGGNKAFKSLDSLCKQYNIKPEARHSAGGDTLTTAMLFLKLLKAAKKRGISSL